MKDVIIGCSLSAVFGFISGAGLIATSANNRIEKLKQQVERYERERSFVDAIDDLGESIESRIKQ